MIIITLSHTLGSGAAKVHILDVGEGDCALLQMPRGIHILIDAGGSIADSKNTGESKVVPYLRSLGISDIDCAIVTHYDTDHAQGMVTVCDELKVRRVIMPRRALGFSATYKTALESIAAKRNIEVQYVEGGDVLSLPGGLRGEVLSPDDKMLKYCTQENELSLVMRLSYGKLRMLFTGDIEKLAESRMLQSKADVDADILKVAHHGSDTSSSDYFIDAVSPELALISSGSYAMSGHPAPRTLVTLKRVGARIERTAVMGDLVVEITKSGAWRLSGY